MPLSSRWVAPTGCALVLAAAWAIRLPAGAAPNRRAGQLQPVARPVTQAAAVHPTLPVIREQRYRMTGRIRPLLFWISRDNVGGARLRWLGGPNGSRGFELLIGSDPDRAPRRVNRWGYVREERQPGRWTVVGVMKQSSGESLEQAEASLSADGDGGFVYQMIEGSSDTARSVSRVTTTRVVRDYSYKQLHALAEVLVASPGGPPRERTVDEPAGARPGFLSAVADLVQEAIEEVARGRRPPGRATAAYAYYGRQYDVTRTSSELLRHVRHGDRTYPRLLQFDFELRGRGRDWKETFRLQCGLDGELAGVPVFVSYQPKWWFKADMVLDSSETF